MASVCEQFRTAESPGFVFRAGDEAQNKRLLGEIRMP